MDITSVLERHKGTARANTGNLYYDKSYPGLLKAAKLLREGCGGESDIIVLAHGMAGWNRGYGSAPNAASLITCLSDISKISDFVTALCKVECEFKADKEVNSKNDINLALSLAQAIMGIKTDTSITMASKLLHFFSPRVFPPLDTNVLNALEIEKVQEATYCEYTFELLKIGVTNSTSNIESLNIYWSWFPIVSPIRVIDCTLYVAGKR